MSMTLLQIRIIPLISSSIVKGSVPIAKGSDPNEHRIQNILKILKGEFIGARPFWHDFDVDFSTLV